MLENPRARPFQLRCILVGRPQSHWCFKCRWSSQPSSWQGDTWCQWTLVSPELMSTFGLSGIRKTSSASFSSVWKDALHVFAWSGFRPFNPPIQPKHNGRHALWKNWVITGLHRPTSPLKVHETTGDMHAPPLTGKQICLCISWWEGCVALKPTSWAHFNSAVLCISWTRLSPQISWLQTQRFELYDHPCPIRDLARAKHVPFQWQDRTVPPWNKFYNIPNFVIWMLRRFIEKKLEPTKL